MEMVDLEGDYCTPKPPEIRNSLENNGVGFSDEQENRPSYIVHFVLIDRIRSNIGRRRIGGRLRKISSRIY